eukprot:Hpha_TRINITY_DN19203_c0_g1::TRINITY_DN19203_c0_g1_i1::g.194249::m.194249
MSILYARVRGAQLPVEFGLHWTVGDLKDSLSDLGPREDLTLLYARAELRDADTLADIGLGAQCTVDVHVRGGIPEQIENVDWGLQVDVQEYNYIGCCEVAGKVAFAPCSASKFLFLAPTAEGGWDLERIEVPQTEVGSSLLFWGVCAVGNYAVYVPRRAMKVVIVDALEMKLRLIDLPSLHPHGDRWEEGCAVGGMVYCCPSDADTVLRIDPVEGTCEQIGKIRVAGKRQRLGWCGAAASADESKIFMPPYNADSVLVFDIKTHECEFLPMPDWARGTRYVGCVEHSGTVYCAPSTSDFILAVDTTSHALRRIDMPVGKVGKVPQHNWAGAIVFEGRVMCAPEHPDTVLVYDTATGLFSTVDVSASCRHTTGKFAGLCVFRGHVVLAPLTSHNIVVLSPRTEAGAGKTRSVVY